MRTTEDHCADYLDKRQPWVAAEDRPAVIGRMVGWLIATGQHRLILQRPQRRQALAAAFDYAGQVGLVRPAGHG